VKTTLKTAPTVQFEIFMAGDIAQAKQACRDYCRVGLCVTIEPCDYVYTGGEEAGFRIGIRNYPRFPSTEEALQQHAFSLAEVIRATSFQHSYMIVGPNSTWWDTTRAQVVE
jgi:hypothetical protein